ncbi:MAG: PGF-CTERM sorting domain-containing protein [ANME-2 cluster archaeon]|nr:PGF-CTERM sorting domain-containing protein [ANME-2 cluster archaeon]
MVSVIFISGCISEKPENVLEKEVKYIENADYEKLLDLYVDPITLQPYSQEEKTETIQLITMYLGTEGTQVKVHEFEIINKEKINDEKYLITTYTKYTALGETKEETKTRTVVKVNGKWKIAEELPTPGFGILSGIISLVGIIFLFRRNKKTDE